MLRSNHVSNVLVAMFILVVLVESCLGADPTPTLQQQLIKEDISNLSREAREKGNPSRGALAFYRQDMACIRCHSVGDDNNKYGPDLTKLGKAATDIYLVESMILPSKVIKKGFETVVITTKAGKTVSGLLAEDKKDAVVIRDNAIDGKLITISKNEIDERNDKGPSLMPDGLINVLSGRQEFLDMARFLMEVAEKGPEYAKQMRPASSLFAALPLPEYEKDIDHAGFLKSIDAKSFKRGEAIYLRVCANCHGTKDQVGSMPTSLRFAEGKFKNGSDPFRMYQTLTHGYAVMTPQAWMVPEQ